jgi:hypothetical protein
MNSDYVHQKLPLGVYTPDTCFENGEEALYQLLDVDLGKAPPYFALYPARGTANSPTR